MGRYALVGLIALMVGIFSNSSWISTGADVQNSSADRIGSLETVVATNGRDIDRLEGRVATLEATTESSTEVDRGSTGTEGTSVVSPADGDSEPGSQGTRNDPVPMGDSATVGDWDIVVLGVDSNAEAQVLAENQFNDPPEPGERWVLITLEGTYQGSDTGNIGFDISWRAVGSSNVAYTESSDRCGVIPSGLYSLGEAFSGGVVQGNICFAVKEADVESLVLYIEPLFSFDSDARVFFALE